MKLNDDQVLEIYELLKHQDIIVASLNIGNLNLRHSTHEIYQTKSDVDILANFNSFATSVLIQGGTETYDLKCENLNFTPTCRAGEQLTPLVKAQQLTWQKYLIHPTSPLSNVQFGYNKAIYKKLTSVKVQVSVNLELILERTRDILDYALIRDCFNNKWSFKYAMQPVLREAYKNSLIQSQGGWVSPDKSTPKVITVVDAVFFGEASLIWNLSKSRLMCLSLVDFRPFGLPQNCMQRQHGKDLQLLVQRGAFSDLPLLNDGGDTSKFAFVCSSGVAIHRYESLDQDQFIIECPKDFEWHFLRNKQTTNLEFKFKDGTLTLPHRFHWGSVVNEIMKQVKHADEWFKKHYFAHSRNYLQQVYPGQPPKQPILKRTLKLVFDIKKGKFSWDEDPLKQIFVEKDDIVETSAERDIFRLNPTAVLNLKHQFKKTGVFNKYLEIEFDSLKWTYELPQKFQSNDLIFEKIQQLDEADQYLRPDQFEFLKGAINSYQFKYMAWHARSFFKPLVEIWGLSFKMDSITALLNTTYNPAFFQQTIERKIFRRFSMPITFNKLTNKWYYDGQLKVQKFNVSFQGYQIFLFKNDLSEALSRLSSLIDISQSLDPKRQFLPYFSGLDRIRNKNHGQLKFSIKEVNLEIWPKRRLNKFLSRLLIQCHDIEYLTKNLISQDQRGDLEYPVDLKHDFCLRGFTVSKMPLAQYESALLNLPLIEAQLFTNYNKKRSLNHYAHQQSQNMDEYLQHIANYQLKDFYLEIKINLPSFSSRNSTDNKSLYLPLLMQSYIENSPVPVVHYQRSYLKFLDEMLQEYRGLIDVSARVIKKRISMQFSQVKQNRINQFCVKAQGFISDVIILFSDFDASHEAFGEEGIDCQYLEPEEIEDNKKRDAYLARYQGIVISTENLCVKTIIQVNRASERIKFNSLDSFFKNNFFRIAAITGRNLFGIRNKCFQNQRNRQVDSMDNYKNFCSFFEIASTNNSRDFETLLGGFKTLFPHYILANEHIQVQITQSCNDSDSDQPFESIFDGDMHIQDFNFKDDDTIAIISLMKYEQNKFINLDNAEELQVRHVVEILNSRFLFTVKIKELLVHHLVKGFDFKQFRKTDYVNLSQKHAVNKSEFLKKYKHENEETYQKNAAKNEDTSSFKNLKKEAFLAVILVDPQINCQNEVSKSQLLFAFETKTTAVLYSYSEPERKSAIQSQGTDLIKMTNLIVPGVVKYELNLNLLKSDCYVAPTYINLSNPTFWANNKNQNQNESVLRKILSSENLSLNIEFYSQELVNYSTPQYGIDLSIGTVTCEMDGPSMFHFVSVSHLILLSRGEKSAELILIEEARQRDLDEFGPNRLKQMIDDEVKVSLYKLGIDSIKPDLNRRVQYMIKTMKFNMFNQDVKFSSGKIESFSGKSMIYSNRESKSDFDVERIQLYNHVDSEEFFKVLSPSSNQYNHFISAQSQESASKIEQDTQQPSMIKIRTRDRYVFVAEAPWQCYDQVEIFIHPMAIWLTQNFYQQFKFFIFENPLLEAKTNKSAASNKFNILINTQQLKEHIKKAKVLSHDSSSSADYSKTNILTSSTVLSDRRENTKAIFSPRNNKPSKQLVQSNQSFPSFFRYFRINEIKVEIIYFHKKDHLMNIKSKPIKLKMPPYISHGTFSTFRVALDTYEKHCRRNFINQIPNFLFRTAAKSGEKVKEYKNQDDLDQEQNNISSRVEMQMTQSRKVLLGDFAV